MSDKEYAIVYPRKRIERTMARTLGRIIMPLAFKVNIVGKENFPAQGPLIVVGNHTAVMEVALMAFYTPWALEFVGSADVPHEPIFDFATRFYGYIPIRRGRIERASLNQAADVLKQKGTIGIFPEGGVWNPGTMRAQTGVAWLSYHTQTPVLPIAFSNATGALAQAAKLKRPRLAMYVGKPMPAATYNRKDGSRKTVFEAYATRVMDAVHDMIPVDERVHPVEIEYEEFETKIIVCDQNDTPVDIPADLQITHTSPLAKFLQRPVILRIFSRHFKLPTQALQNLDAEHHPAHIADAVTHVLNFLEHENPYLLVYRFGPKEGDYMKEGLQQLHTLAQWTNRHGYKLKVTPIRRYKLKNKPTETVQTTQHNVDQWI